MAWAPTDEALLQASVDAYLSSGKNKQRAADSINIPVSTLKARLRAARKRGLLPPELEIAKQSINIGPDGQELQRWDKLRIPNADPDDMQRMPDPRTISRISTLYDAEGRVSQQWITERPEDIQRAIAWEEFAKAFADELPRVPPIPEPEHALVDTLACYPVGDHHLGMLAWKYETGESYDLDIGEKLLQQATDYLMGCTPDSATALIAFLGDFMHYDSFEPVTPTSRNQLDADGRYPKMVRAAVRSMRYMIDRALEKHGFVTVIVEIGNHDLSSSIFLMECLRAVYENEPRVFIDTSPMHYHYFRFGDVLIGTHHGHGSKLENLPLIMATDRAKDWGDTKFRYIWTGHLHSSRKVAVQTQSDFVGCEVEQFRVLPPADAWAAQKGYRSIRDMKAIVMHRNFGEIARITVNPEMLKVLNNE